MNKVVMVTDNLLFVIIFIKRNDTQAVRYTFFIEVKRKVNVKNKKSE